jgi:hypothetical protein
MLDVESDKLNAFGDEDRQFRGGLIAHPAQRGAPATFTCHAKFH